MNGVRGARSRYLAQHARRTLRSNDALWAARNSHPKKRDVFVLDFLNYSETIRYGFADYYRTTILADETDPDKLHDLQAQLDDAQVYTPEQVADVMKSYRLCLAGDGNRSKELGLYNFLGYDITHAWPTSARDRRATNATS